MYRIVFLTVSCFLMVRRGWTQSVTTSHWFNAALSVQTDSSNQWNTDISYRTRGEKWQADQLFLRSGIRHVFDEHWKAAAGMIVTFQYLQVPGMKSRPGKEYRPWQDLMYEHSFGSRYRQEYRIRAEERWLSTSATGEGYRALRLRYRIAGTVAISKKFSLQWSEEYLHQHRTEWKFHHNRVSFAAFLQYRKDWQFQGIYYWAHYAQLTQHIFALGAQKRIWLHANRSDH